ncbi:hypothetical protein EV182_000957, partial [Spiromyces aspiralis]
MSATPSHLDSTQELLGYMLQAIGKLAESQAATDKRLDKVLQAVEKLTESQREMGERLNT